MYVSRMPFAHTFMVPAARAKSKVLKNPLIPVAIESPKLVQSNSVPNASRACNAVFKAPAIVFPTAQTILEK